MPDFHSLPPNTRPTHAIRNNGPDYLVMERFKLRELAEGWPCYRDACEWENFESIFHPGAFVYTTWSGRVPYTDFMAASKAGMDKGAFIMHRCHGVTSDITPDALRAVTKMKATITQRFTVDSCEVDVEADCRFCFFFEKVDGRWGARFVRHWYEKDKVIPINPAKVPTIDAAKLETYPQGYKSLAYFQELTMGVTVSKDMPGHKRHGGTLSGDKHDLLYQQAKDWLDGKDIEV
ncbi:pathogenesis associated protein Pep2 [Paecilomyces variotii No. 5]|uniref:Pathogenesis associated protein Pep2 n=1 Tax=Byssochlamys spectabilis (strain No. 5 / NBRC 109023) TaxID=1356009 RepID=V5FLI4_BYSSN|nr:pathogenesis associated protein Pep2 [Paecilomyces variotii No. 5]